MEASTMRRLHPPLHLLQAFLAVARLGSVSRAAESLHLTQGAVSKRILELEDALGVPLFVRVRRKLLPTPAAQRYSAALRPLLAQVEAATLELITAAGGGGATGGGAGAASPDPPPQPAATTVARSTHQGRARRQRIADLIQVHCVRPRGPGLTSRARHRRDARRLRSDVVFGRARRIARYSASPPTIGTWLSNSTQSGRCRHN
jgi:hypothetical protein